MPLVHVSKPAAVAANVLAWGAIHVGTGYLVHRLPIERLQRDGGLLRERRIEGGGRSYERLGIRHWKDRLPEAGALFSGGVSKRTLSGRGELERFVVETRRAELGHWLAMAGGPLAAIWNPPAGSVLMVAYGIAVNAPFIAVQRYNRIRSLRVLARAADRSSTSTVEGEDRSRANGSSIP